MELKFENDRAQTNFPRLKVNHFSLSLKTKPHLIPSCVSFLWYQVEIKGLFWFFIRRPE